MTAATRRVRRAPRQQKDGRRSPTKVRAVLENEKFGAKQQFGRAVLALKTSIFIILLHYYSLIIMRKTGYYAKFPPLIPSVIFPLSLYKSLL